MSLRVGAVPAHGPLPWRLKVGLAVEILSTYVLVRRELRRRELRGVLAHLRATSDPLAAGDGGVPVGRRLGAAVVRTLSVLPTDSRCLMRSLVLVRLLARRSVDHTFVLAVQPGDELGAHAWVEHEGEPLLAPGNPGFERLLEL